MGGLLEDGKNLAMISEVFENGPSIYGWVFDPKTN
jgi:hypothetical protein